MDARSITTVEFRDEANGVTYRVLAYRELTADEVVAAVRAHREALPTADVPRRGDVVTVITNLGADD